MTYVLVLIMSLNGDVTTKNYAVLTSRDDCEFAGMAVSRMLTINNSYGAVVNYTCKPID